MSNTCSGDALRGSLVRRCERGLHLEEHRWHGYGPPVRTTDSCHIESNSQTFFRCSTEHISLRASIVATHDCCLIVSEPGAHRPRKRRPTDTGSHQVPSQPHAAGAAYAQ